MNTLSAAAAKPSVGRRNVLPSLNSQLQCLAKSSSTISFRFPFQPLPLSSFSPISVCSQKPHKPFIFSKIRAKSGSETSEIPSVPFLAPLKYVLVAATAAAAIFFAGFNFMRPAIASPSSSPPAVETFAKENTGDEEKEKIIEEHLISNPNDVDGLKNLMEIKINSKKIPEAVEIIDKLMKLEPEEVEWPMMKAHLYAYTGELELARNGFNDLLKKDPFCVEAYHGLVTVASQDESSDELGVIIQNVEEAMRVCQRENMKSDLRDFRLLFAQIKVLEGSYHKALEIYGDLAKEEPEDFRPYLCQGIIYSLLRKNSEAEKSFEKYKSLVPKGHPYGGFFDDNVLATKLFAQKMENERAMAKS